MRKIVVSLVLLAGLFGVLSVEAGDVGAHFSRLNHATQARVAQAFELAGISFGPISTNDSAPATTASDLSPIIINVTESIGVNDSHPAILQTSDLSPVVINVTESIGVNDSPQVILPTVVPLPTVIDVRVGASSDDAFHVPNGWPDCSVDDPIVYGGSPGSGPAYGGWRWKGLGIPADVTIIKAFAEFTQNNWGDSVTTTLALEDSASPATFSCDTSTPFDRWANHTAFEAPFTWGEGAPDSLVTTPSLAGAIQELINKHGAIDTIVLLENGTGTLQGDWNSSKSLDQDAASAARLYIEYLPAGDNDVDGVNDAIENGAPNNGDGNNDGIQDRLQKNVASLPNAVDGAYVTLTSSGGSKLVDVSASANPSPANDPPGVDFPIGFFEFNVQGVFPGGSTTVTLFLPPGVVVSTYYKFGRTHDNTTPHWYEFLFDGTTGAEILTDRINLLFVDGQRGDDDLTSNGIIVDPGAPGIIPSIRHINASLSQEGAPVASHDPSPDASHPELSPAGVFTIAATFTNISFDSFTDLFFEVPTLSEGNVVLNADGGPGAVGARITVPETVNPGDTFTIVFKIGMQEQAPFNFFVEALDVP